LWPRATRCCVNLRAVAVGPTYSFGPFQLEAGARRLTSEGAKVDVPARHVDVLVALVARAGDVVSKDALVDLAWRDVAVTDNSLEQAISALRKVLGRPNGGAHYIETVPRQGYRFVADVRTEAARATDDDLEALIAPYRAWVEGRAALESLSADKISRARAAFERVLEATPQDPIAHIGMANACAMQFETTRADEHPDTASLATAAEHAREACRLDPQRAEAWATHGFILDRTGHFVDAVAALGRAVSLEPDNWRHHFRVALVCWGEARLRAARRTLALLPGLPLAHWLAATVHVARQNFLDAEMELRAGIASMEASRLHGAVKFPGVALEWLLGLIALARGSDDEALACFERELAHEAQHHLYARECCANAWYAIGALHLRRGGHQDAAHAFHQAVQRVARHPAAVVLSATEPAVPPVTARAASIDRSIIDVALAQAIGLVVAGGHVEAAACLDRALAHVEAGGHGWLLPVEPMLGISRHPEVWVAVLAQLRSRAA
jgi:DNA-binding winged helix-turn-helix (wHTH) protein